MQILTKNLIISYKLYKKTEKLMEIEYQFAKSLGIPATEDTKYALTLPNKKISQKNAGWLII